MAGKISSFPSGVQSHDGKRGVAFVSTNGRGRTGRGRIGLVTDTVIYPGGTGVWIIANQRVRVNTIPIIDINSIGISTTVQPNHSVGTMIVVQADGRSSAM